MASCAYRSAVSFRVHAVTINTRFACGKICVANVSALIFFVERSWFVFKHFVDVYLYLFCLIGLSVGVTAYFKQVVLEDCSLAHAKLW